MPRYEQEFVIQFQGIARIINDAMLIACLYIPQSSRPFDSRHSGIHTVCLQPGVANGLPRWCD